MSHLLDTFPGACNRRDRWGAMEQGWDNHRSDDYHTRVLAYEKALEQLSRRYPDDSEAAIFYALALNEATDHADKTYVRQLGEPCGRPGIRGDPQDRGPQIIGVLPRSRLLQTLTYGAAASGPGHRAANPRRD